MINGYSSRPNRPQIVMHPAPSALDMEEIMDRPETDKIEYNVCFCILAALAILMVVAGHLGYNIMTIGDLFPYYSFHVPLFVFISGYFYKDTERERPFGYVWKKIRRLLVPYFVWNLFYGVLSWLLRANGFAMGEEISFRTLFLAPFIHGYQFIYNYAAWFVPTLFVIEMMNLLMRLILCGAVDRILRNARESWQNGWYRLQEWLFLAGSLAVGMVVVCLAAGGHVWGSYKAPGRILFLYPCFQMGQFYKKKLERHDVVGNLPYMAVVLGIQVLLQVSCNGLAFSRVWCTGFANGPVIPYVTIVTGIAFWLRTARIITPVIGTGRAIRYLGQNTYTVMMHHVMVFMLIKWALAGIASHTGLCGDFDFVQFYTNIDYVYVMNGAEHFKMVYLTAAIVLPLCLHYILHYIREGGRVRNSEAGG